MNDKERLEMIKGIQKRIKECQEKGQNVSNLHSDYVDWLIEQAEKVEKLTRIAIEADEGCEYWRDKYRQAKAKSERYEKAMENIVISLFPLDINDAVAIAKQALDGEGADTD